MNFSGYNSVRSCVVTPEIVGPTNNSGIGIHSFYLCKYLAQEMQHDVTILLSGPIKNKSISYWKKYYKLNFNIKLVHLSELPINFNGKIYGGRWFVLHSLNIYNWLRHQDFDTCHFQDLYANGFMSIQAKRTGQAFSKTTLTCMLHSPSEWLREGMYKFPAMGLDDLILDYMERYCIEFSDFCLTYSEYMFTWAKSKGWSIGDNSKILPPLIKISQHSPCSIIDEANIIFFCFLNKNNLETFLNALKLLNDKFEKQGKKVKITFLFEVARSTLEKAIASIEKTFTHLYSGYSYSIFSSKSYFDTINFIFNNSKALVVIPFSGDKFAPTVVESIKLGLNVIAENTGGIVEMFQAPYRLFEPNPQSLADKIEQCILNDIAYLNNRYSSELAKSFWKDFCTLYLNITKRDRSITQFSLNFEQTPLVSVCVSYFNHGTYLPQLLKSLDQQTYHNFEVVIINDGSSDYFSNDVFEEMKNVYSNNHWSFLKQSNSGLDKTRNFAAGKAKGRYLVFMDSDNIAKPDMLEKMVKGITLSDIDCLTCYKYGFYKESEVILGDYTYGYVPVGACLEAGVYENVFGDANFIIKKEVFLQLGGFTEEQNTTFEDWEFLGSIVMRGYSLDVIPDYLFLYRHSEGSLSHLTSYFKNRKRALKPYFEGMPLWQQRLLTNAVGSLRIEGSNANELAQIITPEKLGIPPSLFKFIKMIYTKLLNSNITNNSHNLISKILIKLKLLISKRIRR